MILPALLLQVAPPPPPVAPPQAAVAPVPARPAAEMLKPIDAARAIETFRTLCWATFRDAEAFHAALAAAPLPLAAVPRPEAAALGAEIYRSDEAILSYAASDSLPPNVPSRQCRLRVRLAGAADQLALAARIAAALKLPNGRTRTDPAGAETGWDAIMADGRTVRLIAATRNAPHGTDLRLSALLLAPR